MRARWMGKCSCHSTTSMCYVQEIAKLAVLQDINTAVRCAARTASPALRSLPTARYAFDEAGTHGQSQSTCKPKCINNIAAGAQTVGVARIFFMHKFAHAADCTGPCTDTCTAAHLQQRQRLQRLLLGAFLRVAIEVNVLQGTF